MVVVGGVLMLPVFLVFPALALVLALVDRGGLGLDPGLVVPVLS